MMRLKDKRLSLHVGNPVVLEFDSIKKPTNALDFNKGLVVFWCYREFRIKCHLVFTPLPTPLQLSAQCDFLTSYAFVKYSKLIFACTALCGINTYFQGFPLFCVVNSVAWLQYCKAASDFS